MEYLTSIVLFLQETPWFNTIASVVAIASAVAAITPTPSKDSIWHKVYVFVDALAINVGKAKQEAASKTSK